MLSCSSEHFIRIPCLKYCRNVKQDQIVAFIFWESLGILLGLGSVVKNPPANTGDAGSIPGLGRYLGGGNGNPLQYSCQNTEEPGGLQSMGSQRVNMTD